MLKQRFYTNKAFEVKLVGQLIPSLTWKAVNRTSAALKALTDNCSW